MNPFLKQLSEIFNNPSDPLFKKLESLKPLIAQEAQMVYNNWDESDSDTYANGGICHIIAEKIAELLDKYKIEAYSHSLDFKQHVVIIAISHPLNLAYMIDIPETIYEKGGGFSWKKINNVSFDENDVEIIPLNYNDWNNPESF